MIKPNDLLLLLRYLLVYIYLRIVGPTYRIIILCFALELISLASTNYGPAINRPCANKPPGTLLQEKKNNSRNLFHNARGSTPTVRSALQQTYRTVLPLLGYNRLHSLLAADELPRPYQCCQMPLKANPE